MGVPLIDRMLEWLSIGNVDEVVLAVNHLSDKLRMEVAARGLENRVRLSVEDSPLGTGGPLKLAGPLFAGTDPIVSVNGDVVTDIDLVSLQEYHVKSGSDATIALFSVADPRPFGLVTLDNSNRITKFEEKASASLGPGWINAGVYVLNPSVIEMIPSGRAVSLEREIFPTLAKRSKLSGWKHHGLWHDIGKIRDYINANMELLANPDYLPKTKEEIAVRYRADQPSFIGHDCIVETGAKIGANTILSPRVKVRKGALINRSIVFEDTTLGENCRVDSSIVGEASTIGSGAVIKQGSIIAGEVSIPDGTVVDSGSVILN